MSESDEQPKDAPSQLNAPAQRPDQLPESPTLVPPPPGLWAGEAPVGSITSPCETGRYRMILRGYAATIQIEGSLVAFDYDELDSQGQPVKKTVLCQVSKTQLENVHHENRILGPLLREKGRIPGLSGYADNKEVDMLPMDTIVAKTDRHELPRNIPPTGTDVRFASVEDVANFSGDHPALFNIGYLYETRVPVGLLLKHFGPGDDGWGDARMMGVFGATGSGKTVMAASIVVGLAARREIGMLIVDPQGQFSSLELGSADKKWRWDLDEAFRLVGRGSDVRLIDINEIALESPTLFVQLLDRKDFFDLFGIAGHENKERLMSELTLALLQWLKDNPSQTLGDLGWSDDIAVTVCRVGASTYVKPDKKLKEIVDSFEFAPFKRATAKRAWEEVREMFARTHRLGDLLDDVLINHSIVILNVDTDEALKDLFCAEILEGIREKAQFIYRIKRRLYRRGDRGVKKYETAETNALIVLDEAHRFAPQSTGQNRDQERMRAALVDATTTTRKLSVGWLYVTQSLANFDKGIFRQIQTKVLGVGIGTGVDNEHLESALNNDKDLIERYRRLPRPITTGVFPFAIIGELVALGNGSRALFISAPRTQQELFALNPKHFKYPHGKPVKRPDKSIPVEQPYLPSPKAELPPPADEDELPF